MPRSSTARAKATTEKSTSQPIRVDSRATSRRCSATWACSAWYAASMARDWRSSWAVNSGSLKRSSRVFDSEAFPSSWLAWAAAARASTARSACSASRFSARARKMPRSPAPSSVASTSTAVKRSCIGASSR